MSTFTINSKTMHYLDKGQGPVLLFGHSYLWDSEMWTPQIEILSQHYRCIVPDLWSHGQSDAAPGETQNLTDYAQDLLSLMDHLEIETFSIIGLSVGGMWGAELTLLAPARVKALVLMDTFIGLEPQVTHHKYSAMLDMISAAQLVPEPLIEQIRPLFFARDVEQENPELVSRFKKGLQGIRGQKAVDLAQVGRMVFGRRDLFDEVEKLTLPTLIMTGMQDIPRPPLEAQLMQDAISGSRLILVPDAGHISNLEQPEFVIEKLSDFLNSVYA
ncbi:alpha/beta fold hydrolase [Psychromonas ossibalaenae]|uniref:alpha/beta fold hydrolase n=1 Tax=Psychromonas ossibalaenae TaxID=444922 RepID=UPI00035D806F|nr:alpha/beta fold hydrolase [Psychromonas ossibalaenae]